MNPTRSSSPISTTSRSVNINRSGSRRVTISMQQRMEQQQQRERTVATERDAVVLQRHVQPPDPRWTRRRQWNERVLENARGFVGHRMIATQQGFAHPPSCPANKCYHNELEEWWPDSLILCTSDLMEYNQLSVKDVPFASKIFLMA